MRIFAHFCLFGFCLGTWAQDSLVKVDQGNRTDRSLSPPPVHDGKPKTLTASEAQSIAASSIVHQFFAGMKSPSPVTPPLVDSIEKELKKEEANWFPVAENKSKTGRKKASAVSQVNRALMQEHQVVASQNSPAIANSQVADSATIQSQREGAMAAPVAREDSNHSAAKKAKPVSNTPEAEPERNKPFSKWFTSSGSVKEKPAPLFSRSHNKPGNRSSGGQKGLFKKLFKKTKKDDEISVSK